MSHHCPFPVRSTDARRSYHTGTVPGFTLTLALVAALSGYASLSDAASAPARSVVVVVGTDDAAQFHGR